MNLKGLCEKLSISAATGRNWIKLGKIIPDCYEYGKPAFSEEYVEKIKAELSSGNNTALKSRRNKKFVTGNALYNSYVSENCEGISELQKLLLLVEEKKLELSEQVIRLILADCALKLFIDRLKPGSELKDFDNRESHKASENPANTLVESFLKNEISVGCYDKLINALIVDRAEALAFCNANKELLSLEYKYEAGEDILGLIYISCKNIGNRKATGSYYTPSKIVRRLIKHFDIRDNERILDPCCGTGNFLLQLPLNVRMENIYGHDIDETSVRLTRINLALKYIDADIELICEHILVKNYLLDEQEGSFEYIIGNPPWGYDFSDKELALLKKLYKTAVGKNIESYDVFIEQSLRHLSDGGRLAFVLPEAILNVKAHTPVRQYIIENSSINMLDYLGDAFDGVQCPSIILQLQNTASGFLTAGMQVDDGKRHFVIKKNRNISAEYFSFTTTDEEQDIIDKIYKMDNIEFLYDHADFALGIVTGNNKEYISKVKSGINEPVLKGSDICRFHIKDTDNYIVFKPESFQQVAPVEMYRAEEKLLYRFICNQLVFAYDNRQTLSLNSCNIVIPKIDGLKIKYILAVLNSSIAQFIYKKQFNSVKVLRTHIERLPIPRVNEELQDEIIQCAEPLIAGSLAEEAKKYYDILDEKISDIFKLSHNEKELIYSEIDKNNSLFI